MLFGRLIPNALRIVCASSLKSAIEATVDGIVVVNRSGHVTCYNNQFAAMWHIPDSLLVTRNDEQLLSFALSQLSNPDKFLAEVKKLYATPEKKSFDILHFKDGRVFSRYSQPQTIEGDIVGRVWSFRDITKRQKMESAFMRELLVNKAMAEISSELIRPLSINTVSGIISNYAMELTNSNYANASYLDIFTGYHIATAVSNDIWDQCRIGDQSIIFRENKSLFEWVLNRKEYLMINTPADDPRYKGTPTEDVEVERFLSVPAIIDDTVIGHISVMAPGRDYTEEDLNIMERLADLFALAIHRSHIEDTIKRELTFQSSVAKITEALLNPGIDKYGISRVVHEESLRLTDSTHGYVSLIDKVTCDNVVVSMTAIMPKGGDHQVIRFPMSPEG
ncbi:GAF domain-containing protein [Candidatus Magnetobacterium casense]|uniref:GAF domain-containing protein n=1 Tax=Candidatus Magnetobacterium casense TaxID=1455061 RepID=A0ABS6RZ06_9BACT|nr:GAF domain-containing protein [Candidatus Magnetobacterium casensis]MBV6341881.1 GAF domain-containing protein [Candidatus Magnetobacterium casensis]